MKRARVLFCVLVLAAALFALWQLAQGGRIQTDLADLLPQDEKADAALIAAEAAQAKQTGSQIVLLLGHAEGEAAFALAQQTADHWHNSGLFARVDGTQEPDLAKLRAQLRRLGAAALPYQQAVLLQNDPAAYFAQRAEDAANPFSGSLMPLQDDWLGFARFAQSQVQGKLQWQPEHNMVYAEQDGQTWVLLRAVLPENFKRHKELTELLTQSRRNAAAANGRLIAGGGALFAAHSKAAAERESSLMSAIGITLTVLLLWGVLRRGRALFLLIIPAVGLLCGLAATLLILGEIHILTIVIGTSLIGVLIDFPLHWLAPAQFQSRWQPENAMRRARRVFAVSLGVTLAGYVFLWFTPLAVLRQTAVFSAAALAAAFCATVLLLPPLFRGYRPAAAAYTRCSAALARAFQAAPTRAAAVLLLAALAAGSLNTDWRDDIRDWAAMPEQLLRDAGEIAAITGMGSGGQYLLAAAADENALTAALRRAETILAQHGAAAVQSPAQYALSPAEQAGLKNRLREIAAAPQHYAALTDLGLDSTILHQSLLDAAAAPDLALSDSLDNDFAEAARNLYLGDTGGQVAAIVRFQAPEHPAALHKALADEPELRLIDTRSRLNRLFADTRNRALWLKLASFAAAFAVLAKLYGLKSSLRIMAVPLAAVAAAAGLFGWLGLPLGLFAAFGLLLAAAVGVDYAVYALRAEESAAAKSGSLNLAAATTGLSFALLAFSSTAAVAAFGLSVAAGTLCAWLAAMLQLRGSADG